MKEVDRKFAKWQQNSAKQVKKKYFYFKPRSEEGTRWGAGGLFQIQISKEVHFLYIWGRMFLYPPLFEVGVRKRLVFIA